MEKGKLKKSKIIVGKREISVPREFIYDRDEYRNVECEFEEENNKLIKLVVIIDSKRIDISKDNQIQQRKEEAAEKQKVEKEAQRQADIVEKQKEKQRFQQPQRNEFAGIRDSYNLGKAQVPSDTRLNGDPIVIENFALKFYKFARFEENYDDSSKSKFHFFKADRGRTDYEIKTHDFSKINFSSIVNREKQNAKLIVTHLEEPKNFVPSWRLVVGLGSASVYEVGMTLHHVYGFPYIPASGIKGVLRGHIIQDFYYPKLSEEQKNSDKAGEQAEKLALEDIDFKKIFGSTEQQGKAVFFDALPIEAPNLKPDIMNVHYKDWYGEGKPPTDTQQPNPILFLTVQNTPFQFLIGSNTVKPLNFQGKALMTWLSNALEDKGIGAKTAVGYGYMNQQP